MFTFVDPETEAEEHWKSFLLIPKHLAHDKALPQSLVGPYFRMPDPLQCQHLKLLPDGTYSLTKGQCIGSQSWKGKWVHKEGKVVLLLGNGKQLAQFSVIKSKGYTFLVNDKEREELEKVLVGDKINLEEELDIEEEDGYKRSQDRFFMKVIPVVTPAPNDKPERNDG